MGDAAAEAEPPRRRSLVKGKTMAFAHESCLTKHGRVEDFYEMKKALGEGSYGKVVVGKKKGSEAEYAVKEIFLKTEKDNQRFDHELSIHSQLDHPNIVKLYEVYKDAKKVYLIMEMCTGGELFDRIVAEAELHEGAAFGEKDAATYMRQIMKAMVYMHKHGFAHRDIKPENFLLQHKGRDAEIKVIDFGLSQKFSLDPAEKLDMKTKAGTPYYVAPQVLMGKYDEKCDIWSCGVIMYILLCGYPPFYGDRDEDILKRVRSGSYNFPPEDWNSISNKDGARELISMMLTLDSKKRPSSADCLAHPWFTTQIADTSSAALSSDFGTRMSQFRHVSRFKKFALTIMAQQLTAEKDIRELKQTFEAMDANSDGMLTQQEIIDALSKHSIEVPEGLIESISKIDTDGSGCIEYSEFIAATMTKKQYQKEETLFRTFRVFDVDCDGYISVEEVKQILEQKQVDPSLGESIIAEADQDGDGKVSFEEFKDMILAREEDGLFEP